MGAAFGGWPEEAKLHMPPIPPAVPLPREKGDADGREPPKPCDVPMRPSPLPNIGLGSGCGGRAADTVGESRKSPSPLPPCGKGTYEDDAGCGWDFQRELGEEGRGMGGCCEMLDRGSKAQVCGAPGADGKPKGVHFCAGGADPESGEEERTGFASMGVSFKAGESRLREPTMVISEERWNPSKSSVCSS